MMMTEFLLARCADDERAVTDLHQPAAAELLLSDRPIHVWVLEGPQHPTEMACRVLAEVAAKRAIVAIYENVGNVSELTATEEVLRALTAVHADHPDYEPHWAPMISPMPRS